MIFLKKHIFSSDMHWKSPCVNIYIIILIILIVCYYVKQQQWSLKKFYKLSIDSILLAFFFIITFILSPFVVIHVSGIFSRKVSQLDFRLVSMHLPAVWTVLQVGRSKSHRNLCSLTRFTLDLLDVQHLFGSFPTPNKHAHKAHTHTIRTRTQRRWQAAFPILNGKRERDKTNKQVDKVKQL